ncbi:MAG: iron ABC transporter substrate-binding protein [Alphaproteobacteria bacterium]|nr:MAG: iron ABC transporter substrate-binding protein [Alphaproteobacteria bacterium]
MMPLRSTAATRRQKRWGAAIAVLLLAACLAGLGPAQAGDFVDSAGRRVLLPEPIERVMPANPTAEVLVFVLAPERLVGASRAARRGAAASRHVPVLGWRPGMGPASMAETAAQLRAQLILDAGPVTPERAAFADQVQQLAGIPYILVDDNFVRMPSMLRGIGALLGVTEHARHLGRYAEDTINMMRGRLLIQAPETRPHVYYGRRADGLETALPGAPEGESIEQAGAINVARVLGRDGLAAITPAQLYEWNPEIIIAEQRSFYNALRRDRAWRGLSAVSHKRVYLAPAYPFGWIDDPPGVNRLIGLHWLSGLFYPDANQEDLRVAVCEFYDQFYRIKLTNAQIEAMVRPAGAPPVESSRGAPEPLLGIGSIPLPSTPPADPSTPSATVSPLSPVTPSAPEATAPSTTPNAPGLPALPPMPSTASATCTLPGANGPLASNLPSTPLPGIGPPGRRGAAPGLGLPGTVPQ